MSVRRWSFIAGTLALMSSVAGCGETASPVTQCTTRVPIAMITQTLREQGDVVGDVSSNSLRGDLGRTISTFAVAETQASKEISADLATVRTALENLRDALRESNWDVADALSYEAVTVALDDLDSTEVARANIVVESYFLQHCGVISIAEDDASVQTLPTPTGAATNDTEPLTGAVDNGSDARAIGLMVGQLFGLTLDTEQVDCLGTELQNFVDLSDASSSASQYQRQFQRAFDSCGIDFTVPTL